jgi:site-specific DNA-methyltransferase (adenine-specific)
MTTHKALLSSDSIEWETPPEFFNEINKYFGFVIDLAANASNSKCLLSPVDIFEESLFNDMEHYRDFLSDSYAFLNPPYGKTIGKFIKRSIEFTEHFHMGLVMLLPARVDTRWFHDNILSKPFIVYRSIDEMVNHYAPRGITKIALIKGRINFVNPDPEYEGSGSTFPSVLVVMGL